MSSRTRRACIVLMAVAGFVALTASAWAGNGVYLLLGLMLLGVALGWALVRLGRRRPEGVALILAVIVVAGGSVISVARVADGVADARIDFRGKLDTREILSSFHPTGPSGLGDPMPPIRHLGYGYMSSGQATVTVPHADTTRLTLWSIQELAPWLLAAIVLMLLIPILRAAKHGDPFSDAATRRLTKIGLLLLVGIPAIAFVRFVAAEAATAGTFVAPFVEPTFTLTLLHFLPGVLVLVLASVFRRGYELRDFEQHTV